MRVFTAFGLAVLCAGFFPKWAAGGVLAHQWSGCPRIHFWDTYGGCQGTYDYITDSSWEASDASPLVVTQISDEYYCCDETEYRTSDRGCDSWHGKGARSATCVYADNYCPTLTVDDADPAPAVCLGGYTQNDNNLWTGDTDPACTLVWVEEDAVFGLHRLGVFVSNVIAHTCNNPTTPLVWGWNKLLPSDEDVFYVSSKQYKPTSGIITTLPLADSPQKIWVSKPTSDAVVILQLHNKDPKLAYPALSDTGESTFRMRLVAPPGCPSHTTEDLSFLMASEGVYTADGGQMAVAGRATLFGRSTFVRYNTTFAQIPVVLTTLRENTGALQDFIHSRVTGAYHAGFYAVLETEEKGWMLDETWSAEVNFFAIATNGLITGLFGRRKYFAYSSSPPETITETFQTFTYPTDYHPEYLDTALFLKVPHVFAVTQKFTIHLEPVESRIGSSTVTNLTFALREDMCATGGDNVHMDPYFGIFSISAEGDKYRAPDTTTTTTTATTTTTTTTTTTSTKTTTTTSTTTSTTTTTATTTTTTTTTTTITTTTTTTTTSTTTTTTTSTAISSTALATTTAIGDDSSTALIVGVVVGTTAVVAAAVIGAMLYARRAKRMLEAKNRRQDETQPTETTAVDRDQWIEMA